MTSNDIPPIYRFLTAATAGVGRTGTFVALYRMMPKVKSSSDAVDVFGQVLKLRHDRCEMVRTIVNTAYA
jgi:protein tyrosine phosphatase